jgi:hypothetical protein
MGVKLGLRDGRLVEDGTGISRSKTTPLRAGLAGFRSQCQMVDAECEIRKGGKLPMGSKM